MIFLAIYAVVSLAAFALLMIAIYAGGAIAGLPSAMLDADFAAADQRRDLADHRTHNLPDLLGEHGSQDGARGSHLASQHIHIGEQDHAAQ